MASLQNGATIPLLGNGQRIEILNYIAEGGQGEVYKVLYNGTEYALKWYSKIIPTDAFYKNLEKNIKMGAPAEYFLWPEAITEKINGRFGYIMKLRPSSYIEYGEFLLGNARFKSWSLLFLAALNIVEGFFALHSKGYSYQDLNEGSFFINPENGDVLICDNDNVAPFGQNLGVKGMPKYMAPEVVLNLTQPNTHTDRFSLAIILFRLFYIDHPLEGKYTIQFPLTDSIGAQLFGKNPIFVYDPNNKNNRPDPEAHPNVIKRWRMFPPDITAAFTKAFTKGLKDINSRITEQQWKEVLIKGRGMLITIDGNEQFVNAYKPNTIPDGCRLIKTDEQVIAVASNSIIYKCQIDRLCTDYKSPAGLVKTSTSNKSIFGLGNLSENEWKCTLPGKSPICVKKKGFAPLIPGTIIEFGNVTGKVY